MKMQITLDERALSAAIRQYLEERGYVVTKLTMMHDRRRNVFSAVATVED